MPGSNNRSSYEGVFGDSPSSSTPAKKATSQPSSPKNRFPLTGPKGDPLASGNERIKQEVAERRAKTGETDLGNVRKAEEGDFRDVKSFSDAFGRARKLGLKTFQWGNTGMVYGTQLASGTKPADPNTETKVKTPVTPTGEVTTGITPVPPNISSRNTYSGGRSYMPNPNAPIITEQTWRGSSTPVAPSRGPAQPGIFTARYGMQNESGLYREPKPVVQEPQRIPVTTPSGARSVPATTARYTTQNTMGGDFGINRALRRFGSWMIGYKSGGKLEGKEKAFASYLIELSGASTDEELQRFILETGEDEMKNIYLQWERNDGNMGITEAKLGAKLAYIKALRGECPEGYEVEKYMVGGCVKCRKKAEAGTTIEAFKEKCGGKAKKRIKKNKDGGGVNPNDTIHTKKGIRDLNGRTKYPKFNPKDATQSEKDRASEKDYLNTKKSGNDPSRPGTVKKRVTKKD